jgi:hypothetical protein
VVEEGVRGMTNKGLSLTPHLVNNPVALIAFGIGGVLFSALLSIWIPLWLTILLIVVVVVGVAVAVFVLVKHPELRMEGEHLYNATRAEFEGFQPDVTQHPPSQSEERSELDALRVEEYERNRGLFLSHLWRPSEKQGQVADIIIRLEEHRDTSTRSSLLAEGVVESVRYELGRKFFKEPPIKRNPDNGFALEVSAYRPMLCRAEVEFNDGHPPIHLSRYIDFPTGS